MKKIVNVTEVEGEGLVGLLGERVNLWGLNYIYAGTLVGVNDDCALLEDASLIYETGPLQGQPKDAQLFKHPIYVRLATVEMFTKAP